MTEAMPPLVDADWLAAALGARDLVLFDATYYLPTEDRDAYALFLQSHLPGAQFFDIDLVADQETDLPHMVPSAGRFARLMSQMGVDRESRVVFYDQKGLFSAARGWWLMGLFGHDRAAVLDGGLPTWRERGLALEAGPPAARPRTVFVPSFRSGWLRGIGDVSGNLIEGRELLLDARPLARFRAEAPEPRAGLPGGHIPGAASVPAGDLLIDGRTLRAPEALRARFAAAGVVPGRQVVTSCGSGVSAAILSLGLRLAGLEQGALYDGSWTEWALRDDLPRET